MTACPAVTPQRLMPFKILRFNDLVWSKLMREHLLGERNAATGLGTRNANQTRADPIAHTPNHLRGLFVENRMTVSRYVVDGKVIALRDIKVRIPVVGTETDQHRPLALGLQSSAPHRQRAEFPADQWRTQCRDRVGAQLLHCTS